MNQTLSRRLKRYSKWLAKQTDKDPGSTLKMLKRDYPLKKQIILKYMRRYEQINPRIYTHDKTGRRVREGIA